MKAFTNIKLNVAKMISLADRVEHIMGYVEKAGYQHFFFSFISGFKSPVPFKIVKSQNCVVNSFVFLSDTFGSAKVRSKSLG